MRKKAISIFWIFSLGLLITGILSVDETRADAYNINLTTVSGEKIQTPTLPIIFRIYDAFSENELIWEETLNVEIKNGVFRLEPGSGAPTSGIFFENLLTAEGMWFKLEVDGDMLFPRRRVSALGSSLEMKGNYYIAGTGMQNRRKARLRSSYNAGTLVLDGSSSFAKADPPCFDSLDRYEVCGNGTTTDSVTGLIWLTSANCFGQLTYKEAQDQVADLKHGDCGLTDNSLPGDWRLPTKEEWEATVARAQDLACTSPALTDITGYDCDGAERVQFFNGVQQTYYWLSTTHTDSPTNAWAVYLIDGGMATANKGTPFPVWPVRAGR
ncbi:MAG: DUF1566 domain-containing protein [Deltaproteobacteria bacterium]|nr:DUF1566 domain-containing protein [Deltaproteobacteria bacterium]